MNNIIDKLTIHNYNNNIELDSLMMDEHMFVQNFNNLNEKAILRFIKSATTDVFWDIFIKFIKKYDKSIIKRMFDVCVKHNTIYECRLFVSMYFDKPDEQYALQWDNELLLKTTTLFNIYGELDSNDIHPMLNYYKNNPYMYGSCHNKIIFNLLTPLQLIKIYKLDKKFINGVNNSIELPLDEELEFTINQINSPDISIQTKIRMYCKSKHKHLYNDYFGLIIAYFEDANYTFVQNDNKLIDQILPNDCNHTDEFIIFLKNIVTTTTSDRILHYLKMFHKIHDINKCVIELWANSMNIKDRLYLMNFILFTNLHYTDKQLYLILEFINGKENLYEHRLGELNIQIYERLFEKNKIQCQL